MADSEGYSIEFDISSSAASSLWRDTARAIFPCTVSERIALSAHLYERHGVYQQALNSVVSYFVTSLEVRSPDIPAPIREEMETFVNHTSGILAYAPGLAAELLGYGTIFLTVHVPFSRVLSCPSCHARYPLRTVMPAYGFEFHLTDPDGPCFSGICPAKNCPSKRQTQKYYRPNIHDLPFDPSPRHPIVPVTVPPQIMRIQWSPLSDQKIPLMEPYKYAELCAPLIQGIPETCADTRWEYIQSVASKTPITMEQSGMLCLTLNCSSAEKPLYKGWGKPAHLAAFPYAAQLILLEAYNEVITAEYTIPRRVISPPDTANSLMNRRGSQMQGIDFSQLSTPNDFKEKVHNLLQDLRLHPEKVAVAPYPLNYQLLGGEAANMVTPQMLELAEDRLLRAMGVPPELYKGGINAQVAAPAMFGFRMWERRWAMPIARLNTAMDWLGDRIAERRNWPETEMKMAPAILVTDPNIQSILLQRNDMGKVSDTTANRVLGLDGKYERDLLKHEQDMREREAVEDSMETSQQDFNRLLLEQLPSDMSRQEQLSKAEQTLSGGQTAPAQGAPPPSQVAGGGSPQGGFPLSGSSPSGSDLGITTGLQPLQGVQIPSGGLKDIESMRATAQAAAARLITVPLPDRSLMTENLKGQFPDLHMFVMQAIDQMEHQGARMGIQNVREQGPL